MLNIKKGISDLIKQTEIKPGNCFDHSIISITLDLLDTQKRDRSYWKFNTDLLNDKDYVNMVKNIIDDIKLNVKMENKNSKWEFTKCKIRSETLLNAIQKSKITKAREQK